MVNFISSMKATTLFRKKREVPHKYDTMYLFHSPKTMLLSFKILLPEEEAASSSEPILNHPNLTKGVRRYL
jgi:hypothetical protein